MSKQEILKNKPLVEAIFDLRWEVPKIKKMPPNIPTKRTNSFYPLLIGALYQQIKEKFPIYEELDSSKIPEEIANYIVQHRFRSKENGWPIIQIGPGVITLNSTNDYVWGDFFENIKFLINGFFEVIQGMNKEINFIRIHLRYIDAYEFDFKNNNVLKFLNEKMKCNFKISDQHLNEVGIDENPLNLNINLTYPLKKPIGLLSTKYTKGEINKKDCIIWETIVNSNDSHVPQEKSNIESWAENAHEITHKWFFSHIKGELREEFE